MTAAIVVAVVVGVAFAGPAGGSGLAAVPGSIVSAAPVDDPADDPIDDPVEPCVLGPGASCAGADLVGRDLRGADLTGADLARALADSADLSDARLVGANAVAISLTGATLDGADASDADFTSANLGGVSAEAMNGSGMALSWASLANANLVRSQFRGADLSSVMANRADLSSATFEGARLAGANLGRSDLRGASFVGADLRNAWLKDADIDAATDFTGADLSGATWIDGAECTDGSVGRCVASAGGEAPAVEVGSAISGAMKLGGLLWTCIYNQSSTGKCLTSQQSVQLRTIISGIAELRDQLTAARADTMRALNVIILNQKDQDLRAAYTLVANDLNNAMAAVLKYQEFGRCMESLMDDDVECWVSDINGNNGVRLDPHSIIDLYDGVDITGKATKITSELSKGGPAARLLFATLWTMGGKQNYDPANLIEVTTRLQRNIAGDSIRPQDGLLSTTFAYLNAELNTRQQATEVGQLPAYIPGTYVTTMNSTTSFYVGAQDAFATSLIAALSVMAPSEKANPTALSLQALANFGTETNRQISLPAQKQAYTFPTEGEFAVSPVDRVGFFVGADGGLYRIENVRGGSVTVDAAGFEFPSFAQLALFQDALHRAGVRIGRLQAVHRPALPDGAPAVWWATLGNRYRSFAVVNRVFQRVKPVGIRTYTAMGYSCSQSPDYLRWGDNVALETVAPCIIPVRMWDSRPSVVDAFGKDVSGPFNPFGSIAAEKGVLVYKRDVAMVDANIMHVNVDGRRMFTALVTGGAAPAYDLEETVVVVSSVPQNTNLSGTGALFRALGRYNDRTTKPAPADYVSIRRVEPAGLFTRFAQGPVKFATCQELRSAEWRGIGLPDAQDRIPAAQADNNPFDTRANAHRWDADWYELNRHLDVDHDGVACELTQGRL